METDGQLDDFYMHHQFKPSKEEAVTYFLPRLLAGTPLPHGADSLIRHADVYACEPRDLAAQFAPVPNAASTGDRFFFMTCRRKSGNDARVVRRAGSGTWTIQTTEDVYHEGAKVGEAKHLSFKKGKTTTGWVMKEYRCLRPEAVVADGEMVLCKIHLAQHAPAAARQESDAYKLHHQEPAQPAPAQQSHKRPAPAAAAAGPPCSKKMRMAAPVPEPAASAHVRKMWTPSPVPAPVEMEFEDCPVWFTSAAPVSSPATSMEVPHHAPEADGDTGRFSCTMEELLGPQQQQEQTLPVAVEDEDFDWDSLDSESELHLLLKPWDDDDWESEEQTPPVEAEKIDTHQPAPSADWELPEDLRSLLAEHDDQEALLYMGCSYNTVAAACLHAPSLQGFFSFGAVN
ncbi:uncharacterized protein LOC124695047 [Lolium rigidum]|uniref:uncharacterized protein LOC124695047 n=1 Tax=Lolium rigidum TaxID=89674 RepID=UPI001F5C79B0|nr:uncharacterized protein LOC124695047 [Lolium rigidum]